MSKKTLYIVVAVVAIIVIGGGLVFAFSSPTVSVGDNISVYYLGKFTNGTTFGSNFGQTPLNFTVGKNETIPGFDHAVVGMQLNQNKTVTIPYNEAYGPVNPQLIVTVPANDFGNQTPEIGQGVTQDVPNSGPVTGVVVAANSKNVTINFNSPLAGKTLVFTIRVVAIKK